MKIELSDYYKGKGFKIAFERYQRKNVMFYIAYDKWGNEK